MAGLTKSQLKEFAQTAAGCASAGLNRILGGRAGKQVGILVYHRIAPKQLGVAAPSWNVTPRRFQRQLRELLALGYHPLKLAELLDYHARGIDPPAQSFVVTFDDGFASVFHGALPALRELGVPATVFVNTAHVDGELFPFDDWGREWRGRTPVEAHRPLSTGECGELLASGFVEIGTHTHTHDDYRGRPAELEVDLRTSLDWLANRFGIDRPTFAFPFGRPHLGYASAEMMEAARRVGVRCALTTECVTVDLRSDPFGWGRFNAYESDTGATLAAKCGGWYGWAPRMQEWLARPKRERAGASA